MPSVSYPAIIERGRKGFGAYFPDLPGCVSVGATLQKAIESAQEALTGHVAVTLEYREPLPEPSALIDIRPFEGSNEVHRTLVTAILPRR